MTTTVDHSHHFKTLSDIRTPKLTRVLGWMLVLTGVAVAAFLWFTPWVQTAAGSGSVTALNPNDRLQEINALVSGRIDEWFVHDGLRVEEGDPIVRIVDNDPQLLDRLEAERAQVVTKLEAARSAVATAELDLTRTRELYDEGLASRREFEQAQLQVQELRSRVADAAGELERVNVNLSRQSVQIVRAPRDGVILQINAGDTATVVNAGEPVASFIPAGVIRAVELYIDGRDISLVDVGAKARLQFEGWPAVQFSGWPSKAVGTFGGIVNIVDPSAQANGRFRVLVTEDPDDPHPWPDDDFVRFGAQARGWILLEEVTVGYEIWRQLNNFPPELPNNATTASAAQ